MHRSGLIGFISLFVAACGGSESPSNRTLTADGNASAASSPASNGSTPAAARWDLQSSGEGTALVLVSERGGATVRLFCPAASPTLLVNVPEFRPIGSEERLSLGSGGHVAALVADPRGDSARGGVTATAAVPAGLEALIGGPVSVSYGAQTSGPHAAPPLDLVRAFTAACRNRSGTAEPSAPSAPAQPCLMQGNERLAVTPLRVVGTEPFWGARIEGRCVTYSHPEDQQGTRVWTRYTLAPGGGTWIGALGGRRFELRVSPRPGCSDGMSDRRYPLEAELLVNGERRRGCAAPA